MFVSVNFIFKMTSDSRGVFPVTTKIDIFPVDCVYSVNTFKFQPIYMGVIPIASTLANRVSEQCKHTNSAKDADKQTCDQVTDMTNCQRDRHHDIFVI